MPEPLPRTIAGGSYANLAALALEVPDVKWPPESPFLKESQTALNYNSADGKDRKGSHELEKSIGAFAARCAYSKDENADEIRSVPEICRVSGEGDQKREGNEVKGLFRTPERRQDN